MLRFINILETNTYRESKFLPRTSSLAFGSSGMPEGSLRVVGVLPHGYEFTPSSEADRDALVEFLEGIVYS